MNTNTLFTESLGKNKPHLTEEGVALYVDALLLQRVEELPSSLRNHVENCLECEIQIMGVYELSKKVTPIAAYKPHPYFDRNNKGNKIYEPVTRYGVYSYRIAAAVGGAALLAAGYYALISGSAKTPVTALQQNTPPQQTVTEQPKTNTAAQENALLLADNFSVSPNLEDLVHGEFRSTTVEVTSPSMEQKLNKPIVFQWNDINEPVTIKILTNKERQIVSSAVKGNSYTYKKKLEPGLYYWKLETDKDLLHVGKFLVK